MLNDVGARYSVSNLTRGLDVMELLARHPEGLGITEIAQQLSIPKNAAFRITAALSERGYLLRSDEGKSFTLSPRLMTLGYKAANHRGLIERAMPHMRELRDATQETVLISARVGAEGIVLDQVPGLHPFRFVVDPGMTLALHTSAPGKALLAWLPAAEQEDLVERLVLTRFTDRTITTQEGLRQELAAVRERGYALDRGEQIEGVHCAAAPLRDARGYPVAAINVTGPASRLTEAMLDPAGVKVRECAQRISATLGVAAPAAGRF